MFTGGLSTDIIAMRTTSDAVAQVTRHDIGDKSEVGTISEAFPHLIFEGFTSPLGLRTANILRHLFPVPKDDSKRVLTFANVKVRRLSQSCAASCAYNLRHATLACHAAVLDCKCFWSTQPAQDYISFRHHTYEQPAGVKSIELKVRKSLRLGFRHAKTAMAWLEPYKGQGAHRAAAGEGAPL